MLLERNCQETALYRLYFMCWIHYFVSNKKLSSYTYDCKSLIKRQILFRIYLSGLFFFNSFSILSMLDLSEISEVKHF